jgi:threonine/homoserine efflux transporter RhtA
MSWMRNTFRLVIAIGSAAVLWFLLMLAWALLGDHRFSILCVSAIPAFQAVHGWEKLGEYFPSLFGDEEDKDEDEEEEP